MAETFESGGYVVEFPEGLALREDRVREAPFKQPFMPLPFVIRGEPGLLEVRFSFGAEDDPENRLDVYHEDFSSVLRPAGLFTNFLGKRPELRGEVSVPVRLFPVRLLEVRIRNLSNVEAAPPGA